MKNVNIKQTIMVILMQMQLWKRSLLPLHHGMKDSMFDRLHNTIEDFLKDKN